jgi:hypothetical protein
MYSRAKKKKLIDGSSKAIRRAASGEQFGTVRL